MAQEFSRHSGRSEDFLLRPKPGSPGYVTSVPEGHVPDSPPEDEDVYDLPMHDDRRRKGGDPAPI